MAGLDGRRTVTALHCKHKIGGGNWQLLRLILTFEWTACFRCSTWIEPLKRWRCQHGETWKLGTRRLEVQARISVLVHWGWNLSPAVRGPTRDLEDRWTVWRDDGRACQAAIVSFYSKAAGQDSIATPSCVVVSRRNTCIWHESRRLTHGARLASSSKRVWLRGVDGGHIVTYPKATVVHHKSTGSYIAYEWPLTTQIFSTS
jgi:hypothetical protein